MEYKGSHYTILFYKSGGTKDIKVSGGLIRAVSFSSDFGDLIEAAASAYQYFSAKIAKSVEPVMMFVETEDYESIRVPGLITINRPQQGSMRYLQQRLTRWNVWQVLSRVAQQWWGQSCRALHSEDFWVLQGLVDSAVESYISDDGRYKDFFVPDSDGKSWLKLNNLQMSDLVTGMIAMGSPNSALLDEEGRSFSVNFDRPFMMHKRLSQALRYMRWYQGPERFEDAVREVFDVCRTNYLSPRLIEEATENAYAGSGSLMRTYLASNDWPDVSVKGKGAVRGKTRIELEFLGDIRLPVDLSITRSRGRHQTLFVAPTGQSMLVDVEGLPDDVEKIEVNPGREMFDKDRFNNKSGFPRLSFFPGSARGLEDDAYTILWYPFATKLPGQALSLELGWQAMRYLGSSVAGTVRNQPETGRTGFTIKYSKSLERSRYFTFSVLQDSGQQEEGTRLSSIGLTSRGLFGLNRLAGAVFLNAQQQLGRAEDNHADLGVNLDYKSEPGRACGHTFYLAADSTAYVPSDDFKYQRYNGNSKFNCQNKAIGVETRIFAGTIRKEKNVPESSLLQIQNVAEARVRLDRPSIEGAQTVASTTLEIILPAGLPLPDSMFVLPKRSQIRMFGDWGKTWGPEHSVFVSGVGMQLPIGGDLAGSDTFTLLSLSLNGIFYRSIDGKIDRRPGVLFDFSGAL